MHIGKYINELSMHIGKYINELSMHIGKYINELALNIILRNKLAVSSVSSNSRKERGAH